MRSLKIRHLWLLAVIIVPVGCWAADAALGLPSGIANSLKHEMVSAKEWSPALRILLVLTVLSLVPALLIATTSFMRIIVVLAMLRHALGMQDTPPNVALISIALFLTLFSMMPTLTEIDAKAWQPYAANHLTLDQALNAGAKPIRDFMVRQTREQDMALMVEISHSPEPETVNDIGLLQLIPAFMLSELRSAFQIGFVVFLPFLLIDLVVASVLASLGMMMVPPVMISLPLKVLTFILIDGWNLVVRAVLGSFH